MSLVLSSTKVSRLASLRADLSDDFPNIAFLDCALMKNEKTEIWKSGADSGQSFLVVTHTPFNFILGEYTQSELTGYINILKEKQYPNLVFANKSTLPDVNSNFKVHKRIYYSSWSDEGFHLPVLDSLKFSVEEIDENHLSQCAWVNRVSEVYGDSEGYLESGYGYCALLDDKIISEVHGVIGTNVVEVGTTTLDDYRGQNLSSFMIYVMSKNMFAKGYKLSLSHDETNPASKRLAEKTGYKNPKEYYLYSYE